VKARKSITKLTFNVITYKRRVESVFMLPNYNYCNRLFYPNCYNLEPTANVLAGGCYHLKVTFSLRNVYFIKKINNFY